MTHSKLTHLTPTHFLLARLLPQLLRQQISPHTLAQLVLQHSPCLAFEATKSDAWPGASPAAPVGGGSSGFSASAQSAEPFASTDPFASTAGTAGVTAQSASGFEATKSDAWPGASPAAPVGGGSSGFSASAQSAEPFASTDPFASTAGTAGVTAQSAVWL